MGLAKFDTLDNESLLIKNQSVFGLLFRQLRPKQWTKNLLVFAALIFSVEAISVLSIVYSFLGFFAFCLVSSAVYILNDYMDIESDRKHPEKKFRPMASGLLNPKVALGFGAIILAGSIAGAYVLTPLFAAVLIIYFIMNVSYSIKLKHVVVIDIMIIAAGFVLRAIAGGLVIDVIITPWFLLCTMLLSLFLAISKRRHEVLLQQSNHQEHRKVLKSYSLPLLDQLNGIVTTAAIMSYCLFTFTSGHTVHLMWTIPLVIYGIFRYLYLVHVEGKGGAPEKVLLEDSHILTTVILYVIAVVVILGVFE